MPVDEYGNYTDENGNQGSPPPQQPLDEMLPQMMGKDAAGSIGGHAYTPESGGMPSPSMTSPMAPEQWNPWEGQPAAMSAPVMPGAPAPYSGYVNPFNDAIHSSILNSLTKNGAAPSLTDPTLSAQAGAYQDARERSRRQQQEGLAERAHATGATTGGLDSEINQGYESAGRDIGAYNANLIGTEAQRRNANLMNTIGLGAGVEAAGGSNQLGQDTLGFNVGTEEAALNAALMRALMGGV